MDRQLQVDPEAATAATANFALPPLAAYLDCPQLLCQADHTPQHQGLAQNFGRLWHISGGQGATDEQALATPPIVVGGMVIVADADGAIQAVKRETGALVWRQTELSPEAPPAPMGLAGAEGRLIVATGQNSVAALDLAQGKKLWQVTVAALTRGQPAIANGYAFVTLTDGSLVVLDIKDGKTLWRYQAQAVGTGFVAPTAPAVARGIVAVGWPNGDLHVVRADNALPLWQDQLGAASNAGVYALNDLVAPPVIHGTTLIAVTTSGPLAAYDLTTGQQKWRRPIAAYQAPWIAGDRLFVTTTQGRLLALAVETGAILWSQDLHEVAGIDADDRAKAAWTSPILGGGRVIVAGTSGQLLSFAAKDGALVAKMDVGAPVRMAPVAAFNQLLIYDDKGGLTAYGNTP
jgi:outer membrane protein assembly factor BamB